MAALNTNGNLCVWFKYAVGQLFHIQIIHSTDFYNCFQNHICHCELHCFPYSASFLSFLLLLLWIKRFLGWGENQLTCRWSSLSLALPLWVYCAYENVCGGRRVGSGCGGCYRVTVMGFILSTPSVLAVVSTVNSATWLNWIHPISWFLY